MIQLYSEDSTTVIISQKEVSMETIQLIENLPNVVRELCRDLHIHAFLSHRHNVLNDNIGVSCISIRKDCTFDPIAECANLDAIHDEFLNAINKHKVENDPIDPEVDNIAKILECAKEFAKSFDLDVQYEIRRKYAEDPNILKPTTSTAS